jgi:hypothetical protein
VPNIFATALTLIPVFALLNSLLLTQPAPAFAGEVDIWSAKVKSIERTSVNFLFMAISKCGGQR